MDGRNETEDERLDRKFDDLLQELRVMQTGTQLTAGFLLTLSLMIIGIIFFTFDMVIDRTMALVAGAGIGAVVGALLVWLPTSLARSASRA